MQSVKHEAISTKKEEAKRLCREGLTDEALRLNTEALAETDDPEMRFVLAFNGAWIERMRGNPLSSLAIHTLLAPEINSHRHCVQAKCRNGLGATYRMLGMTDKAYVEFEEARYQYELAGDWRGFHLTENNITFLLIDTGKANEALSRLFEIKDRFIGLNELALAAQVDDSLAQAYLKIGTEEALSLGLDHAIKSLSELRSLGEVQAAKKSEETLALILEKRKTK